MSYIGKQPTKAALTSSDIEDGIITAAKIEDGAVVAAEIASNAVTTAKINADAVTAAKIADNAVVTAGINADAITGAKIADNAINSEHYTDGSIDTAHIAADQITEAKIADNAISEEHLDVTAITGHTAETTVNDSDLVVIHDASATALRKMTVANLTANAGTAGLSSSSGNITITDGNLVVASGHGIDFSATSDSSGTSESELLHDYEEGTFTPTLTPTTAGSTGYNTQAGYYVKIGKFVSITGAVGWTSQSGSGQMRVAGLPFSISSQDSNYGSNGIGLFDITLTNEHYQAYLLPQPGGTYANIWQCKTGERSAAPHDASGFITIGMAYEAST